MKKIALLLGLLALAGCSNDNPTAETPQSFANILKKTSGFEDCEIAVLTDDRYRQLYVVRCPHSVTSTRWQNGKQFYHTTVMD